MAHEVHSFSTFNTSLCEAQFSILSFQADVSQTDSRVALWYTCNNIVARQQGSVASLLLFHWLGVRDSLWLPGLQLVVIFVVLLITCGFGHHIHASVHNRDCAGNMIIKKTAKGRVLVLQHGDSWLCCKTSTLQYHTLSMVKSAEARDHVSVT